MGLIRNLQGSCDLCACSIRCALGLEIFGSEVVQDGYRLLLRSLRKGSSGKVHGHCRGSSDVQVAAASGLFQLLSVCILFPPGWACYET